MDRWSCLVCVDHHARIARHARLAAIQARVITKGCTLIAVLFFTIDANRHSPAIMPDHPGLVKKNRNYLFFLNVSEIIEPHIQIAGTQRMTEIIISPKVKSLVAPTNRLLHGLVWNVLLSSLHIYCPNDRHRRVPIMPSG